MMKVVASAARKGHEISESLEAGMPPRRVNSAADSIRYLAIGVSRYSVYERPAPGGPGRESLPVAHTRPLVWLAKPAPRSMVPLGKPSVTEVRSSGIFK